MHVAMIRPLIQMIYSCHVSVIVYLLIVMTMVNLFFCVEIFFCDFCRCMYLVMYSISY